MAVPGGDPEHTDELRIDLDPSPGVTFDMVREAAAEVRAFLAEEGIVAFPKTTGNRGLHLYVRVEPGWDSLAVRQAAVAVARAMEERRPDLITGAWWKEERALGSSSTSTRTPPTRRCSAPGACGPGRCPGVDAVPWDELRLHPDELTIAGCPAGSPRDGDPWAAIDDAPQSIEPLVDRYRADLAARHPRRPVAARVPEDARRGPPGSPSRARHDPD